MQGFFLNSKNRKEPCLLSAASTGIWCYEQDLKLYSQVTLSILGLRFSWRAIRWSLLFMFLWGSQPKSTPGLLCTHPSWMLCVCVGAGCQIMGVEKDVACLQASLHFVRCVSVMAPWATV